jgi:hypothetical protein
MKSLYDLLGARENDDADPLKKAFRRAIKANHPDLHPGDPDAAEQFSEIIAAVDPIFPQFHTNSNGLGFRYNAEQRFVGQRMFFLHDGHTSDLSQAIQAHFSTSTLVEAELSSTLILGLACVATNNGIRGVGSQSGDAEFQRLVRERQAGRPRLPAVAIMSSMKRSKRATLWSP